MTTRPNPWAVLRDQPHLRLHTGPLPAGYRGLTDGTIIWLSDRLTQRERRSTLAHELVHVRRGHRGHQPACVEDAVQAEAARWLLPDIHELADVLAAEPLPEAAQTLWVSDDLLTARLAHLHPSERAYLQARAHHLEGIAA